MALNVPSASEVHLLEYIVGKVTPGSPKLKLFSNNATISDTTVLGDLTECAISGYSAKTLTSASWTVTDVGPGVGTASYAQQTFNLSGSGTVYGYFVTDSADAKLLWVEKFSTAAEYPSGGGNLLITPTVTLD